MIPEKRILKTIIKNFISSLSFDSSLIDFKLCQCRAIMDFILSFIGNDKKTVLFSEYWTQHDGNDTLADLNNCEYAQNLSCFMK